MSNLSSLVNVTIQTETAGVPRESFGFPLILSPNAPFAERVRQYEDLQGLLDDGYDATDPEYLAAEAMFGQEPKPERIMMGRIAPPSLMYRLTPVAANSVVYAVEVDGEEASFTSDASGTVAEITAGLKAAIDALSIAGCTTTDNGTSLDIAFTAGLFKSVVVAPTLSGRSSGAMSVAETTIDTTPGTAAELAAIAVENSDWYGLVSCFRSKTLVDIIAAWAETAEKLFLAQSSDSAVINTTSSGTDDVGESTSGADYNRTHVLFHEDPSVFFDARLMGRVLPEDAGTEKWHLVNLTGIEPSTLTSTQKANAASKNVAYYTQLGQNGFSFGGKAASGEWLDVVRGRDAIKSDVEVAVSNILLADQRTPYTAAGLSTIQGAIKGVLMEYVESGVLSSDPEPVVRVPDLADVSTADKAARVLNGVRADATLAGAIFAVNLRITLAI